MALLHRPALAQSFDIQHQHDLSTNPTDLHFRLSTDHGVKTFHRGERIPLVLEFWSDSLEKYQLNDASYDRSGRLPTEEFILDRNDVVDPYADYFYTGVLGGIGGGLRGNPVLDGKPEKIELDLNDWFRFDQAGTYRLYLKSHRLSRERNPGETGDGATVQFAAVSNVIDLQIVADDPSWTESKLRAIESLLAQPEPERPKPGGPPVPVNPLEDQLRLARRELRYLSTSAALALELQNARKSGNSPDTLLLVGARDREQAIAAYDRYLADRTTPIHEWDIQLRSLFTFVQKEAPSRLPMSLWQMPEGMTVKKIESEAEARQKRFAEIVKAEAIRLIPAAKAKDKAAGKVSADAIAALAPAEAKAANLVPPDDYGLSREELIAQFSSFPVEQQLEILGKKWDLVRGPEMIPALRSVIDQVEPGHLPEGAMALQAWGAESGVGEAALRRLNELSPQEAYDIWAKDIAGGNPRFAGLAAREIEAQDMPEADGIFMRWLAADKFGALPLIAKFGSAKLADEMRKRYLAESWPCAEEGSFITYFVRALPLSGPGAAGEFLKQALGDREGRGCHHFLLTQVAQTVWKPVLEDQAILSLNDSDPETVTSAVQTLVAHGSADVEPYLWKRLEQWSERWRGRTSELEGHAILGSVRTPESRLGFALFNGIASAKSWILDEPRRARLSALCLDDPCREQWAQPLSFRTIRIDVSNGGGSYPAAFRVDDGFKASTLDALREKLLQYPEGTTFRWCPHAFNPFDTFSPGQREEMYQQIKPLLTDRSMTIEPYSEEKCLGRGN